MALACDPRLCSHIEAAAKCTMSASASEPCAGHAPAHLMPLLDNCSECGLAPQLWRIHAVRGKRRPAFPPRTQHVWCTGRGENGLRAPLTNVQLHTRYRASLRALEKAAPHESLCEIETAANSGHVFEGRKLQSGLPVAVRNLRLLYGSDSGRATLRLTGPLLAGDTVGQTRRLGNGRATYRVRGAPPACVPQPSRVQLHGRPAQNAALEPLRRSEAPPKPPIFTAFHHLGDKHLVSEAHLVGPTAAGERILGDLELVVRLHWPKGERRWSDGQGGWHWPRPVNCTVKAAQADGAPPSRSIQAARLECASEAGAAEFWKRCRARLAVTAEDEAATERNWGVMGANNLMQHALEEVDGWPTLLGGGCCAYPASDHSVVPVPVELRRRIPAVAPAVVACEAEPGSTPSRRAQCAVQAALRAIEFVHDLSERHRVLLLEHVRRSNDSASHCGQLDLRQFCFGARARRGSAAFDTRHGSARPEAILALCDTDFVGPRLFGLSKLRPLPFSTAVFRPSAFAGAGFKGLGGFPPASGIVDLPCALANTLLQPLSAHFPPLRDLSREVTERYTAMVRGAPAGGVVQLSLSCMHAWLTAAADAFF